MARGRRRPRRIVQFVRSLDGGGLTMGRGGVHPAVHDRCAPGGCWPSCARPGRSSWLWRTSGVGPAAGVASALRAAPGAWTKRCPIPQLLGGAGRLGKAEAAAREALAPRSLSGGGPRGQRRAPSVLGWGSHAWQEHLALCPDGQGWALCPLRPVAPSAMLLERHPCARGPAAHGHLRAACGPVQPGAVNIARLSRSPSLA